MSTPNLQLPRRTARTMDRSPPAGRVRSVSPIYSRGFPWELGVGSWELTGRVFSRPVLRTCSHGRRSSLRLPFFRRRSRPSADPTRSCRPRISARSGMPSACRRHCRHYDSCRAGQAAGGRGRHRTSALPDGEGGRIGRRARAQPHSGGHRRFSRAALVADARRRGHRDRRALRHLRVPAPPP